MSVATMFIEAGPMPDCRTLLSFRLGDQTYAFAVESIVQIIPMATITPLPQLDETVEGVINVQGKVVPVVDMRRHLDLAEVRYDLYTPILLVDSGEWIVGLIVDEVLDVLSLRLEEFVPPTQVLPRELGQASVVRDLVRTGGGMTLFLDPEHLFLPHQRATLGRAARWLHDLSAGAGPQAIPGDESKTWAVPEVGV